MKPQSPKISIVGNGSVGGTFERLLRHTAVVSRIGAARLADRGNWQSIRDSNYVFYCLSSCELATLTERLSGELDKSTLSVGVCHGLDDRGRYPAQIFADTYGTRLDFGVMYGPMLSAEMSAGRPGYAQVGLSDITKFDGLKMLFEGMPLYLEPSADLHDLSIAAVLTSVYATLFGVADGLELGANTRGYLATTITSEMRTIIEAIYGNSQVAESLAGLGTLITDGTSGDSPYYRLGLSLAKGVSGGDNEALHTVAMIRKHGLFSVDEFPIFQLAADMLVEPDRRQFAEFIDRLARA